MKRGWYPVHNRGGHAVMCPGVVCETLIPSDQALCTPSKPGDRLPVIDMSGSGGMGRPYYLVADDNGGWKREEWDYEC